MSLRRSYHQWLRATGALSAAVAEAVAKTRHLAVQP
jgi:hypothetical protein